MVIKDAWENIMEKAPGLSGEGNEKDKALETGCVVSFERLPGSRDGEFRCHGVGKDIVQAMAHMVSDFSSEAAKADGVEPVRVMADIFSMAVKYSEEARKGDGEAKD